jgi:DNA polymerase-3 subunit delta'
MAFSDLPQHRASVHLLQKSLARGRLGHAYLLLGESLDALESLARNFAKTINCERFPGGFPPNADACDVCLSCRKIEHLNHPDVRWVRPESKTRIISVEQVRELMRTVYLKPTEGRFKTTTLVAADRLNPQAANAFLKTLEEPPANTVFILLSTDPQRILETVLSRCLRLHCGGGRTQVDAGTADWVATFANAAAEPAGGLFARYRLLDRLLQRLELLKSDIEKRLSEQSLIEQYDDADPKLIERWKAELAASIEAEYRRSRAGQLVALQLWLRDVWLAVRRMFEGEMVVFPDLADATHKIAGRLDAAGATRNLKVVENTQRLLHTNVQEALALEIGLLRLSL